MLSTVYSLLQYIYHNAHIYYPRMGAFHRLYSIQYITTPKFLIREYLRSAVFSVLQQVTTLTFLIREWVHSTVYTNFSKTIATLLIREK